MSRPAVAQSIGSTGGTRGRVLLVTVAIAGGLALLLAGYALAAQLAAPHLRTQSSAAQAGLSRGSITIDDAPEQITILAKDIGDRLYDATIDYAGSAPEVTYAGGNLSIARHWNVVNSWGRRDLIEVSVNPAVAWSIRVNSAWTTARVDLSAATLRSFELNGARNTVTLASGLPVDDVRVTVSGVGSGLTMSVPASAQYSATADGPLSKIDGATASRDWPSARNRYHVSVSGVGQHATIVAAG